MKKLKHIKLIGIFSAVFALAVGTLLTATGSAATAGFYLAPGSQTVTTGSGFNVQIRINASAQPVDTVLVHITYPSDKLQMVGSISYAGSPFESHASQSTSAGDISFVAYTTGTAPNSDVIIATVAFTPINSGTATINFASDTAAASAGVDVTGGRDGGTYTIQAPAPTPTPTPSNPSGGGSTPTSGGTSSGSSSGSRTSGGTSTATGGGTSGVANGAQSTTASGAVVAVDGNAATQVTGDAEATQTESKGFFSNYWLIGAIGGGALLIGTILAVMWVTTGRILPFGHKGIKADKYSYSYKADPDIMPAEPQTLSGGTASSSTIDDRLQKIQGKPAYTPGETVHPTTPAHTQGGS